jgi:hypothetical protein
VSLRPGHRTPWQRGGTTNEANPDAICCRHHHAKHDAGWTPTRHPDRAIDWTSPTGHHYTEPAPTYPTDTTTHTTDTTTHHTTHPRDPNEAQTAPTPHPFDSDQPTAAAGRERVR